MDENDLKKKFLFSTEQIQKLIDRTKVRLSDMNVKIDETVSQEYLPIVYDKRIFELVLEKFELIKNIQESDLEIRT